MWSCSVAVIGASVTTVTYHLLALGSKCRCCYLVHFGTSVLLSIHTFIFLVVLITYIYWCAVIGASVAIATHHLAETKVLLSLLNDMNELFTLRQRIVILKASNLTYALTGG